MWVQFCLFQKNSLYLNSVDFTSYYSFNMTLLCCVSFILEKRKLINVVLINIKRLLSPKLTYVVSVLDVNGVITERCVPEMQFIDFKRCTE